jgi:hypothetical protein
MDRRNATADHASGCSKFDPPRWPHLSSARWGWPEGAAQRPQRGKDTVALAAPAAHATGDLDVEDGGSASAQTPIPGATLAGWGKRDLDTSFGFAMAAGVDDLLDGWANRDLDIDQFGSAMVQQFVPRAQAHDKFV